MLASCQSPHLRPSKPFRVCIRVACHLIGASVTCRDDVVITCLRVYSASVPVSIALLVFSSMGHQHARQKDMQAESIGMSRHVMTAWAGRTLQGTTRGRFGAVFDSTAFPGGHDAQRLVSSVIVSIMIESYLLLLSGGADQTRPQFDVKEDAECLIFYIRDQLFQDIATMINTNVLAASLLVRLFCNGMLERNRGHIINVSSIAAKQRYPGDSPS